ncbi:hypothetical protein [Spirillospora sp. NPDC047279]|uniref:hypothetical protein n=1 Tax=Spirillospora sp. NPDC047279 TaxID=3155478 RepID=UPI0033D88E8D
MRAELAKLTARTDGHSGGVGTVGAWDVPEELAERVGTAHQSMSKYVGQFVAAYQALITRIETSAKDFDLSDLAAQDAASGAGRGLEPPATRESQN